ncbi:hypothetical protein GCM10012287_15420 [Streptomyces daqingensis]|uniref:Uncharacterized protein n=1 Tax=Streptomyces daqingensis TaxID=1472640 RepID=A0ABQ2M2C3_9ACTN|nr:hypothetical protein GCM10012287_15420 [Streptomyces daqingensis]
MAGIPGMSVALVPWGAQVMTVTVSSSAVAEPAVPQPLASRAQTAAEAAVLRRAYRRLGLMRRHDAGREVTHGRPTANRE